MADLHIKMWELKTSETFEFEKNNTTASPERYFDHRLRIDKPAGDLFSALNKSNIQRAIDRAHRCGLVLRLCESREGVDTFIRLESQMRREKGLLPQPRRFFKALWDIMGPEKMIEIRYADYEGQPISAIMLLKYKDTVMYEYGATEAGFHRLAPSPFLLWGAILQACEEGYKIFDFGRTDKSEQGLVQFKSRWGAQQQKLTYYEIPHSARLNSLRRNGRAKAVMAFAMRTFPATLSNAVSNLLYKHLV